VLCLDTVREQSGYAKLVATEPAKLEEGSSPQAVNEKTLPLPPKTLDQGTKESHLKRASYNDISFALGHDNSDDVKLPDDTKIAIQTERIYEYSKTRTPDPSSPYSQPPSPYRSQYSQPPSPYPSHIEQPPSPYRTESKIQWEKEVPNSFKPDNLVNSGDPPAPLDEGREKN
jgi:hypothetical protein